MGKPTGFKEIPREMPQRRPVKLRILDWNEIYNSFGDDKLRAQGARCMDCGIPFCHQGCPLGNIIPEWNDLVYKNRWREAIEMLHKTNNFPEWTGRICPAPCEEACVLGINERPVTIKNIEYEIIEHAWDNQWIEPDPPKARTGKTVAVIGSGPAGLACAAQLNKVNLGDPPLSNQIHAKGKHVIILGGGDTGADCLGTAVRQGAKSIKQFELLPRPPESRDLKQGIQPWPYWPMIYRTSSAHE